MVSFANFFDTPAIDSAAPQAFGFNGFFKGAYSYHFHNFWYALLLLVTHHQYLTTPSQVEAV